MSGLLAGTVRSALSGDTLLVRPAGAQVDSDASITLHVAGLQAPRLGSRERTDEPGAYAARDALRVLAVGKPVRWRQAYTVPAATDGAGPREYAHVFLPPAAPGQPDRNVAVELLTLGVARVHDGKTPAATEQDKWREPLRQAQLGAQQAARGLWAPVPPGRPDVHRDMPAPTLPFFAAHKEQLLDAVVEQVKDGSMLRVRLLLSPQEHQLINLGLAGARAPRYNSLRPDDPSNEPLGKEATRFVEDKLLQRTVKVRLLSLPPSASAAPAMSALLGGNSKAADETPQAASHLIGTVLHPAGDIAQFLLASGLAKVVDWHVGVVNAGFPGKMEQYRATERMAREQRRGLWANVAATPTRSTPATAVAGGGTKINGRVLGKGTVLQGTVVRVVSPDSLLIAPQDGGAEQRVFFASLRAPLVKDEQLAGYSADAREWLRAKTIGKPVRVVVDYVKPKDGDYGEKVCGTVYTVNKKGSNASLGEQLVAQGLLLVARHRKDDEDVAAGYTDLVTAEAAALAAHKGLHSGQPKPLPRIAEASETAARANTFLSGFKRAGKLDGVVEHVGSPARVRVFVPRENARLTLVLAGVRAPRTARANSGERDPPGAAEALHFAQLHLSQRDVTFEVSATDRTGAFIGALYLPHKNNYALELVREGYAEVHNTADQLDYVNELYAAEEEAKAAGKGIWKEEAQVAAAEAAAAASPEHSQPQSEYAEVVITNIRGDGGNEERFGFNLQLLSAEAELSQLVAELSLVSSQAAPLVATKPRPGDWVAAQHNGQWVRAVVQKPNPGQDGVKVHLVDSGLVSTVPLSSIRALDARFGRTRLSAQATEARLAFAQLWDEPGDDAADAIWAFRQAVEGRKLLARIVHREGAPAKKAWGAKATPASAPGLVHVVLYDPDDERILDPAASINRDLVAAGWAVPDKGARAYASNPAQTLTANAIAEASRDARRQRAGIFLYGDPTADE